MNEILDFEEKKTIFKEYLKIIFKNPKILMKNKDTELYASNNGCHFFISYDSEYEEISLYIANHHHFKQGCRDEYTNFIRRYLPKRDMLDIIVSFSNKVGVL